MRHRAVLSVLLLVFALSARAEGPPPQPPEPRVVLVQLRYVHSRVGDLPPESIWLTVYESGQVAQDQPSSDLQCERAGSTHLEALSALARSVAVQGAMASEAFYCIKALPTPSLMVILGRSNQAAVFSPSAVPEPIRGVVAAVESAIQSASCSPPPASIQPLLTP